MQESHDYTHLFRHWFATTEYKITEKVEIVQKLLGHKDIKSTYRYIHSDTYELSKFAAPLLNAAIEAINQGKFGFDLRANTTKRGEGESNPRSHREWLSRPSPYRSAIPAVSYRIYQTAQ